MTLLILYFFFTHFLFNLVLSCCFNSILFYFSIFITLEVFESDGCCNLSCPAVCTVSLDTYMCQWWISYVFHYNIHSIISLVLQSCFFWQWLMRNSGAIINSDLWWSRGGTAVSAAWTPPAWMQSTMKWTGTWILASCSACKTVHVCCWVLKLWQNRVKHKS